MSDRHGRGTARTFAGMLEDAVLLIGGALLVPVVIVVIGTPLVLVVRMFVALIARL